MDWDDLLTSLALVMVVEGIMPFLSPSSLRNSLRLLLNMDDASLRIMGLISMAVGLLMLNWVRG
jgi:uncharacterized protein